MENASAIWSVVDDFLLRSIGIPPTLFIKLPKGNVNHSFLMKKLALSFLFHLYSRPKMKSQLVVWGATHIMHLVGVSTVSLVFQPNVLRMNPAKLFFIYSCIGDVFVV